MITWKKTFGVVCAAMFLAAGSAQADPHGGGGGGGWNRGGSGWHGHGGYYGGGYSGAGRFWGGVGIGLGVGALASYWSAPSYWSSASYDAAPPYYGSYIVSQAPPIVYYESRPVPAEVTPGAAPAPAAATPPEPVVYPHNGQSTHRIEVDRRECNRWATTQQSAMADASVFQRATAACLEGRGYTVR